MPPDSTQLQVATVDNVGVRALLAAQPQQTRRPLSRDDLEAILAVTRALAAPFDLPTMLAEVTVAAKRVLHAERCSVWLHDAATDELVAEISSDIGRIRIPFGRGLVGACATSRTLINVPDCYADPRFDTATDRGSGFRTRCSLTLPLVDHRGELVGAMQVLNKEGGVFGADDEALAQALAAQCAVALSRVRMTEALLEGEKLKRELELAHAVQLSALPASMPVVAGYDMHATFLPAAQTGGDTYDLALVEQGLLVVLGDATGHGIAPALLVMQMHAMLRMALRMGADLEAAFRLVNDRLAETLADDRFVTAFIGLLDPATHRLRFLSGGQGPVLHWRAASCTCDVHGPTSFPLGAMAIARLRPAVELEMLPGDVLALLSDGIYEYPGTGGALFGEARVVDLLRRHGDESADRLAARMLDAARTFADGAPQDDDVTLVLLKREGIATAQQRGFARSIDALDEIVAFTRHATASLAPAQRESLHFVIEELFTNMVKYAPDGGPRISIEITCVDEGADVTLIDDDVDPFDPTAEPDARVDLPIDERTPGGLGLHVSRRLAESLSYDYDAARREGRTSFRIGRPAC